MEGTTLKYNWVALPLITCFRFFNFSAEMCGKLGGDEAEA